MLQSSGYLPLFDLKEANVSETGFAPGQYSFMLSSSDILVEIHTERTLRYFPTPLDFQELTRRLIYVEVAGRQLPTFSVEDTIVMLCVHGAKHFWERLMWILDIAKLITAHEVNWAMLLEIAAERKSTRVVLLGLYLAHDLLGASLPPDVLQRAEDEPGVRWLARKVCEQYAQISDPGAGVWSRASFRLRSRDTIGQGLRHMLRLTLSPTESDRQFVSLFGFLSPFYILVRPFRLLCEYGWGIRGRINTGPAAYEPRLPICKCASETSEGKSARPQLVHADKQDG